MGCSISLDGFKKENSVLDVSAKYNQLMLDTLGESSLYMRAKDTFKVLFSDIQITEQEKAKLVSDYVANITVSLSSASMQTALQWAKEERDGGYQLAKIKADTELVIANRTKVKEEICLSEKQTDKVCAETTSIIATSIRENGKVIAYEAGGCIPTSLENAGLRYEQTKQVEADTYGRFADAYRKSGVVEIGISPADGITKGIAGNDDGYTWQQALNAERQRYSYEDSKVNHAANASASMIAQMLAAEIAPSETDIEIWRTAMNRLVTPNSQTPNP